MRILAVQVAAKGASRLKQLTDRVMVGVVAGMAGHLTKHAVNRILKAAHVSRTDSGDKAATMFVRPRRHPEPAAVAVGALADATVSALFGVGITYMLSATGGDRATLKGALAGATLWATVFGGLSHLGINASHPVDPKSALGNLCTQTLFGAVTAAVVERIASPALFNGEIPLIRR